MTAIRPLALLATAAASVALLACGGGGASETGGPGAGPTVTVATAHGAVAVPVTRERIWALDEYAALSLLALDVVPEHAGRLFDDEKVRRLLADGGTELVDPVNVELVAAARPTMIVGVRHPETERLLSRLRRIAPVVTLDERDPWQEQLAVLAAVTGRRANAAALVRRVDRATDALAARLASSDDAGATVSVLATYPDRYFAYDDGTPLGRMLERLGFERPAAQIDDDEDDYGFEEISPELLREHRGDIVVSLVDDAYTGGRSVHDDARFDFDGSTMVEVDYLGWFSPTPLSAWWILHDVEAVLLDGEPPASAGDAPELWRRMTGAG